MGVFVGKLEMNGRRLASAVAGLICIVLGDFDLLSLVASLLSRISSDHQQFPTSIHTSLSLTFICHFPTKHENSKKCNTLPSAAQLPLPVSNILER
jgi:hypothetical protein